MGELEQRDACSTQARAEIMKATDGNPPPVLDPFCGGGSIPLEAQRLGLEAHASDLNPVAVLITKALIEIPPKFAGEPPVNPEAREKLGHGATWKGAQGLAEDVRYYGKWMRDEALERIGHLYPKAKLAGWAGGDRHRLAVGADGYVPEPRMRCRDAAGAVVRALHEEGEGVARRAGRRAWRRATSRCDEGGVAPDGTVGRRGARCIVCERLCLSTTSGWRAGWTSRMARCCWQSSLKAAAIALISLRRPA